MKQLIAFVVFVPAIANAQVSYEQLQSIARRALNESWVDVSPPSISTRDTIFSYQLGSVSWTGMTFPGDQESALQPFLRAAMQIEVIRKYRNSPAQQQYWAPYLQRAEQTVRQALEEFQAANSDDQRSSVVHDLWEYQAPMREAFENYAAMNGYTVEGQGAAQRGTSYRPPPPLPEMLVELIRQSGDQLSYARAQQALATLRSSDTDRHQQSEDELWKLFNGTIEASFHSSANLQKWGVRVLTQPPNATIWVMPIIEQYLAQLEGRQPHWTLITQPDAAQIVGVFYYYLRWDDGSGRTSGPHRTQVFNISRPVILR